MKKICLALVACLSFPFFAQAKSSGHLLLAGTVPEKIDFQLSYSRQNHRWVLIQKTNGHLRASLVKSDNSQYIVSVQAP